MLDSVIAYVQSADPTTIYLFLFLSAFLKNFIPLVPLDLPIALTGYLIIYKKLSIFLAIMWPSLNTGIYGHLPDKQKVRTETLCKRYHIDTASMG